MAKRTQSEQGSQTPGRGFRRVNPETGVAFIKRMTEVIASQAAEAAPRTTIVMKIDSGSPVAIPDLPAVALMVTAGADALVPAVMTQPGPGADKLSAANEEAEFAAFIARLDARSAAQNAEMDALLSRLRTTRIAA